MIRDRARSFQQGPLKHIVHTTVCTSCVCFCAYTKRSHGPSEIRKPRELPCHLLSPYQHVHNTSAIPSHPIPQSIPVQHGCSHLADFHGDVVVLGRRSDAHARQGRVLLGRKFQENSGRGGTSIKQVSGKMKGAQNVTHDRRVLP